MKKFTIRQLIERDVTVDKVYCGTIATRGNAMRGLTRVSHSFVQREYKL